MISNTRGASDQGAAYERHQGWPPHVCAGVAEYLHAALQRRPPRRCLFLGTATGINDVLPFARRADKADRILGGDIVPEYLERLRAGARRESLANVEARAIDVESDLPTLGVHDLVVLFFVIHRCARWREVVAPLADRVAEGGSLFVSEFVGPGGVIYLSNEGGGSGTDPVSRLIRRYWEILPESFDPELRSTRIGPMREMLSQHLRPAGFRDFIWPQRLTPADMADRIASRAYAPYFSTRASPDLLERLRREFASEWETETALAETIRVHRFARR